MYVDRAVLVFGVVLSISCGVLLVQGYLVAFVGEIVTLFDHGNTSSGLVVNLCRDESYNLLIGSILFESSAGVYYGARVAGSRMLACLVIGDYALGSMIDPIGSCVMASSNLSEGFIWVIDSPAPAIVDRQSVHEPLQTGLISIDTMIPIGRGQRELVVGDRQTGKTSLGLDCILNQSCELIACVYSPIGQKACSILQSFLALCNSSSKDYLTLLYSSSSSSSVCQFLCAYSGAAVCEYFMYVRELGTFLLLDDLSRHAVAYREIYLLLRRPPGREAYPGEIFFVHSRLLERSAKLSLILGGGSFTSFPVIETLASDVSSYITTNVISITDGQIFLSHDLFMSGVKPAVDVGLSVSRVGSAAQWYGMKMIGGSYKLILAQFVELQSFSQFSSDLTSDTRYRLDAGQRLVQLIKQSCGEPIPLVRQVSLLSLTTQGIIDSLPVHAVRTFVRLHSYVPEWIYLYASTRLVASCIMN